MAHEVFISYRKSISKDQAQILKTRIDLVFGDDTAFLDNDDLQIGDDWATKLEKKLTTAKVIVVVIGLNWTSCSFSHTIEAKEIFEGERRINHPHDWVCKEIEFGFQAKKIFPVYMGGAKVGSVNPVAMPRQKPYLRSFFEDVQGFYISDNQQKYEFSPIFEHLETKGLKQRRDELPTEKVALHDFHQYTCNRRTQLSQFEKIYENKQAQKVQFYYVLGKEEQAHFGFVNRVTYEKSGHLWNITNPDNTTSNLSIEEIVLENISGLKNLKTRLIRELFAKLKINANANDPILTKNIQFLCANSPIIQQMNGKDFVSIQISIYEDEWDEEETPALAKWFIYEFCKLPQPKEKSKVPILPDNTPTFLFFFSIIFDEANPEVMELVQEEVENGHSIKALPKLTMVSQQDIKRWFRKYKIIAPDTRTRDELIDKYFENQEVYEMETVQINLKKIIDEFNNK